MNTLLSFHISCPYFCILPYFRKSSNEIINDVINSPANKSHIPDTVTLTKWEETESRRQLTTILEQIESGGAEYLGYLDEYIKDYQERNAADDE